MPSRKGQKPDSTAHTVPARTNNMPQLTDSRDGCATARRTIIENSFAFWILPGVDEELSRSSHKMSSVRPCLIPPPFIKSGDGGARTSAVTMQLEKALALTPAQWLPKPA